MLGAAVGVKQPRARKRHAEPATSEMTDAEQEWLAGLPERPAPRILSKADYWAMREAERE